MLYSKVWMPCCLLRLLKQCCSGENGQELTILAMAAIMNPIGCEGNDYSVRVVAAGLFDHGAGCGKGSRQTC